MTSKTDKERIKKKKRVNYTDDEESDEKEEDAPKSNPKKKKKIIKPKNTHMITRKKIHVMRDIVIPNKKKTEIQNPKKHQRIK